MTDEWVRNARVIRLIDGDTIEIEIDLGYRVFVREKVRLYGINAPECRGKSKEAGRKATEHLKFLFNSHSRNVKVRSHKNKKGKYGRWVVEVISGDLNINQQMVLDGHAVEYMR